ncbi:unnamed protein product [Pedinophyceae sp. YPF-701]|nr:unnamed protein product [Pedinophyceae sp. YPF-701]
MQASLTSRAPAAPRCARAVSHSATRAHAARPPASPASAAAPAQRAHIGTTVCGGSMSGSRRLAPRVALPEQPTRRGPAAPCATADKQLRKRRSNHTGVYLLLLLNTVIFVVDRVLHQQWVQMLYLNHAAPIWWQFITCCFCHASWDHISSNLFLLLVFGRLVEEEEGALGVWATYLIAGVGGALSSFIFTPQAQGGAAKAAVVSLGASGAVFGLFVVSVLVRLAFDLRKLLEGAILGQFVYKQLAQEAQLQLAGAGAATGVSHVAHLGGALAGVFLILLLSRIAPADDGAVGAR